MNQRQSGSMGDELTNAALIGLIGMFGIALILRAAGSVTAFLTGRPQPEAGPASGLTVLFNPSDPAAALGANELNPVIYWLISIGMLGGLAAGIVWTWIMLRHHTRKAEPIRIGSQGLRPVMRSRPPRPGEHSYAAPEHSGRRLNHRHRGMSAIYWVPVAERRCGPRWRTRSC